MTILSEFRRFLETHLFAAPLDSILSLVDLSGLYSFAESQRGDFSAFLRIADDLELAQLGRGPGPLMSYGAYHDTEGSLFPSGLFCDGVVQPLPEGEIAEDVTHSLVARLGGGPGLCQIRARYR